MSSGSGSSRGGGQSPWPLVCAVIALFGAFISACGCLLAYLTTKSVWKIMRQTETMKSIDRELSREISAAVESAMLPGVQVAVFGVALSLCAIVALLFLLSRKQRGSG